MQHTKNIAPDPAAANPTISEERRAFIKAHFQHYGVWSDAGWESLLTKTEDKLCQLLATTKYVKASQAYFVFESEKLAWGKHVRACGLNADEHRWPWPVSPNPLDLKAGISAQYKDWRSARGLPLEKPPENKAAAATTTPKPAPKKQDSHFKNVDDLASRY